MTKLRAILRRRWPVLLVCLLLGMAAGVASTAISPKRETTQYKAEQVIVANRLAGNPANVDQDSLKVNRGEVPEVAAEKLDRPVDEASDLSAKVAVKADTDSSSIKLTVYDTDPEQASKVVQAFSESFLEVVNADLRSEDVQQLDRLNQRVEEAEAELAAFDAQYGFISRNDVALPSSPTVDALVAERRQLAESVSQAKGAYDQAELETTARQPYSSLGAEDPRVDDTELLEVPTSPLFRAGLLGTIGLLLGVGLVMIIERVNQRVDTREELAELVSVPIIAEIGNLSSRKRPSHDDGRVRLDGVWSEHYRRVRSAIQFVQSEAKFRNSALSSNNGIGAAGTGQGPTATPVTGPANAVIAGHRSLSGSVPRVFLFASALPGEGKSTSVALTAMALAETGMDTLVINADFRRPQVENYLGADRSPSLADRAELSNDRLEIDQVVQGTDTEHLFVASSGPPTHEVGGRLAAAREIAEQAAAEGGTVLIDSSPLRVSNDPIDLLSVVDEVILVVRAGRTTVKSLEDTVELLEMHHAPVLGIVLIGTLATREMYAYYQSYYQQADQADREAHRPDRDPEPPSSAEVVEPDLPDPPSYSGSRVPMHASQLPPPPPQFGTDFDAGPSASAT